MPIPKYHEFMLPILEFVSDGRTYAVKELIQAMANYFELSDEERRERLPSGRDYIHNNRVRWARTYLTKARLLETPSRGHLRITERGVDVLDSGIEVINRKYLMRFPEFVEFQSRDTSRDSDEDDIEQAQQDEVSPEENLEAQYQKLRDEVEAELLGQIMESSPEYFEQVVVELLLQMGYGGSRADAGRAIGGTHDGGIDGIIKEDRLGLDVVYIQAKRWANTVGRPEVQQFAGALQGNRARKGVFITTSTFSNQAREFVNVVDAKIILIDGKELSRLMFDFNVGVTSVASYEVKRVDLDFFLED